MKKAIVVIFYLLALTACKNKNGQVSEAKFPPEPKADVEEVKLTPPQDKGDANADMAIDPPVGNSETKNTKIADTSKKIIKNGTIEFETSDLKATRKSIFNAVTHYGGYVDEDNESMDDDSRREYELKIRVPSKYFDGILESVSSTADKIDSKHISITDVTTQFIDINSRLANKKALEKRYIELLAKAGKMSDVLEIENKLNDIRSDIESTQGQLNYLSRQVSYSTLDITFYTKQAAQVNNGDGLGYKLKEALAGGWDILQSIFFGIIRLWPVWIVIGLFYILIKRWRRKRKSRAV